MSPKAKEMNAKINKWDLIKQGFYTARQPMECENIFINNMKKKRLIFKIYN